MSDSLPTHDTIWEEMVRGDQSRAEILFRRHSVELLRFAASRVGARRGAMRSEPDDIVQECFACMLQLSQRLRLLHQQISSPDLLTQLLAELTRLNSPEPADDPSDLALWLTRILKHQLRPLLAAGSADTFRSVLLQEYTKRTEDFPLRAWLFAAAKSKLSDGFRASRQTAVWDDDFDPPAAPLPDDTAESDDRRAGLAHCLPKLTDEDRSLLQIRFSGLDSDCLLQQLESATHDQRHAPVDTGPAEALRHATRLRNMTYAQIAAKHGLTEGAVGKRMRELYSKLKSCIERHLGGVA